jgi:glycosyltransferase involved in cell wall biosynthesis
MIPFQRTVTKYSKIRSVYVQIATSWAIKKSTAIIAVSQNTKQEIIKYCRVPATKVFVSLEGVNSRYRKIDSLSLLAQAREKYNLPERYILFVGTLEPGKNLTRLLEAFCQLKQKNRLPHKLVIVGAYGWGKDLKLLDAGRGSIRLRRFNFADEIIFTGYVPEEDLPFLYNAAELFVFPSLYEGFGLPVLEAMACGTPVIASNLSSLPEIVGDAGLLINPYDINEIAAAMAKVLNDKDLQTELISKGLKRVQEFSWRKSAEVIFNTFKIVGGKNQ